MSKSERIRALVAKAHRLATTAGDHQAAHNFRAARQFRKASLEASAQADRLQANLLFGV